MELALVSPIPRIARHTLGRNTVAHQGIHTLAAHLSLQPPCNTRIYEPEQLLFLGRNLVEEITSQRPDIVGISLYHFSLGGTWDFLHTLSREWGHQGQPWLVFGGVEVGLNYDQVARIFLDGPLAAFGTKVFVFGFGQNVLERIIESKRINNLAPMLNGGGVVVAQDGELYDFRAPTKLARSEMLRDMATLASDIEHHPRNLYPMPPNLDNGIRITFEVGCRGRCHFCIHGKNGLEKYYSLEEDLTRDQVAREITKIIITALNKNPSYKPIFIADEDFLKDKELAKLILREIIKEQGAGNSLYSGLEFFASIRADSLGNDTETLELLTRAGFVRINIGVESFSDRVLKGMNKGMDAVEQENVIEHLFSQGIVPEIGQILFYPTAHSKDVLRSAEKSLSYLDRGANISIEPLLMVCPGTADFHRFAGLPAGGFYSFDKIDLERGVEFVDRRALPVDEECRRRALECMEYFDPAKIRLLEDWKRSFLNKVVEVFSN